MAFRPWTGRPTGRVPEARGLCVPLHMSAGLRRLYCSIADRKGPVGLLHGRYRPLTVLGKGTFSKLIMAEDLYNPEKKQVAIKILNRGCDYIGIQERHKIQQLNDADPRNEMAVVRLLGSFRHQEHYCLVLELLGYSLLQFTKISPGGTLHIDTIRKISIQLVAAFAFIHRAGIIHADLKPENVLLTSLRRDGNESLPCGIRIVDFGNSMTMEDTSAYYDSFQVQSLFYRAPEVVLGDWNFGFPIDMWSLGCLLAELYRGRPLFPFKSVDDLFHNMIATLGPLPAGAFSKSQFHSTFIKEDTKEMPISTAAERRQYQSQRCASLSTALSCDDDVFIDFLAQLLEFDPRRRLTPHQALLHPFLGRLFPFALLLATGPAPSAGRSPSPDEHPAAAKRPCH